jgi:hypothetical protein
MLPSAQEAAKTNMSISTSSRGPCAAGDLKPLPRGFVRPLPCL